MTDAERQLLRLLADRSFKRGTFTLASGATSSYYIDGKMTQVFSAGAYLIGQVIYERSKDLPVNGIGGLEVGAVPLTAAAVIHYHLNGRAMEGFWVRDKAKGHGTRKQIEGGLGLGPGSKVLIVDDVITTGGSSLKAIQAVREMGCEVVQALAVVDRLQGAADAFKAVGVDFRAIFTIRDLGVDVPDAPPAS